MLGRGGSGAAGGGAASRPAHPRASDAPAPPAGSRPAAPIAYHETAAAGSRPAAPASPAANAPLRRPDAAPAATDDSDDSDDSDDGPLALEGAAHRGPVLARPSQQGSQPASPVGSQPASPEEGAVLARHAQCGPARIASAAADADGARACTKGGAGGGKGVAGGGELQCRKGFKRGGAGSRAWSALVLQGWGCLKSRRITAGGREGGRGASRRVLLSCVTARGVGLERQQRATTDE